MPADDPREPVSVAITLHPYFDEDGTMHYRDESWFEYADGTTGPLPDGKTYYDYLPEWRKKAARDVLADLLVRRALERVRGAGALPPAPEPGPPPMSLAAQEVLDRFRRLPVEERDQVRRMLETRRRRKRRGKPGKTPRDEP